MSHGLTFCVDGHWKGAKKGEKTFLYQVQIAPSGRARCRRCSQVIAKGDPRFGIPIRDPRGEHGYISAWQHVKCTRIDPIEIEGTAGLGDDEKPATRPLEKDDLYGATSLTEKQLREVIEEVQKEDRPDHLQELNPEDLVKRGDLPRVAAPVEILQHLLPFQEEGLGWLCEQELSETKGGILADEMGMGKTIQTVSLIVKNRGVGPTLVVAPVSSMLQWHEEIKTHVLEGHLKVVVFQKAGKHTKEELETADVVLTTYPVLEHAYRAILNEGKVPCQYCGKLFLPRKLKVHNRYFCGPNAKKTAKQMKQEKDSAAKAGGGGKQPRDNKKQSKETIKKGLRTLRVDVDDEDVPGGGDEEEEDTSKATAGSKRTRGGKAKKEVSNDNVDAVVVEEEQDEVAVVAADEEGESTTLAAGGKRPTVGPIGMYQELMRDANRHVRSRWEKARPSGSSEDDDEEEHDDEEEEEEIEEEEDNDVDEESSEEDEETKLKREQEIEEEKKAMTELFELNKCNDCGFPLMRYPYCPKTGQHHPQPQNGPNEEQDTGGDVVDLSKSMLHSVKWFRIVLDEAHRIKSRTTGTSRAAFALNGERKWCLTGTPLQNRVGDLYSLLRFLRFAPYARYYCSVEGCHCSTLSHPFSRDMLSSCVYCGHGPLQHFSYFNKHIMNPIVRYGYVGDGRRAMMLLSAQILNKIMLRRTKTERAEDLKLPPCQVEIVPIDLNEEEMDFYTSLYKRSTAKFDTFVKKGTVLHNYAHIFQLLSRLRQALDHPYLVVYSGSGGANDDDKKDGDEDEKGKKGKKKSKKSTGANGGALVAKEDQTAAAAVEADVCGLCQEDCVSKSIAVKPCKHVFHRSCLREFLDEAPSDAGYKCPTCFCKITIDFRELRKGTEDGDEDDDEEEGKLPNNGDEDFLEAALPPELLDAEEEASQQLFHPNPDGGEVANDTANNAAATEGGGDKNTTAKKAKATNGGQAIRKSSILNKVDTSKFVTGTKLDAIANYVLSIPDDEKCIVFSQFASMLDIIAFWLQKKGLRVVKLLGSMPLVSRQSMISQFKHDDSIRVILISLKAGGEGLNLQNANHVVLADPWWNPAVEMQAVQRAHRIGQTRPVKAVRFVTRGTVEERMMDLQEKKLLVFEGTIDGKANSLQRLTEEDLQFLFTR